MTHLSGTLVLSIGGSAGFFDGLSFQSGIKFLLCQNGLISFADELPPEPFITINTDDCIIAPGLVDLQVNGGGGILWNQSPTLDSLKHMAKIYAQLGTTSFLPTLITDSWDVFEQGTHAVEQATDSLNPVSGIVGIHWEGPFLNPDKKGIHPAQHIEKLNQKAVDFMAQSKIPYKLLTLAPECQPQDLLQLLSQKEITLFAGHTDATFEEIEVAQEQYNFTGITHLFNACSPFLGRAPGVVGAGLLCKELWCSVIADGVHVHPRILQFFLNEIAEKRGILVSDAMPPVGAPDMQQFSLCGQDIFVRGTRLEDHTGRLAGCALSLFEMVKYVVQNKFTDLATALRMASWNPAQCIGLKHKGMLKEGYDADIIVFDKETLSLRTVIQKGQVV